jgi:hypothetical protein
MLGGKLENSKLTSNMLCLWSCFFSDNCFLDVLSELLLRLFFINGPTRPGAGEHHTIGRMASGGEAWSAGSTSKIAMSCLSMQVCLHGAVLASMCSAYTAVARLP